MQWCHSLRKKCIPPNHGVYLSEQEQTLFKRSVVGVLFIWQSVNILTKLLRKFFFQKIKAIFEAEKVYKSEKFEHP